MHVGLLNIVSQVRVSGLHLNVYLLIPSTFQTTRFEVEPYVGGLTITATDSQLPGDVFYETIYIKKH